MLRRGETGQTIVILAFGFIVLLAFIGIVTDVSLLFVRYTTLRRAVDAAAVAAAGQVRRPEATTADITKATTGGGSAEAIANRAAGYAYARNVATVNLTARQYIEFYGLQPSAVVVDTCATVLEANDAITYAQLFCDDTQQPRKLVKVTAQIESFTTFLRLIGWDKITLQATSISETAVLDIVMIFDVSESMAVETTYDDWANVPGQPTATANQSMRYLPPRISSGPLRLVDNSNRTSGRFVPSHDDVAYPVPSYNIWNFMRTQTQRQLLDYQNPAGGPFAGEFPFRGYRFWVDTAGTAQLPSAAGAPVEPREECRIRYWPYAATNPSLWDSTTAGMPAGRDLRQEYTAAANLFGLGGDLTGGLYPNFNDANRGFDGFAPAFNYFGCCNDPNGDGNFADLICQPFRQLRQASDEFIQRIDFSRGDRVAFVTFDRDAYLVDPPNVMVECGITTATNTRSMMTDPCLARATLSQIVGVRAEPNFYADTDSNGLWDSYVIGGTPYIHRAGDPIPSNVLPYNYNATGARVGFNQISLGALNSFPVYGDCFMANAVIPWPRSPYASPDSSLDLATNPGAIPLSEVPRYGYNAARFPTSISGALIPPLNNADWDSAMIAAGLTATAGRNTRKALISYQFRAGCRDSNVGASLRVANNALTDPATVRVNGAVWVMVMLGDGAAAGTDPMTNAAGGALTAASGLFPADAGQYATAASAGQYGAYGACPFGTASDPGPLTDNGFEAARPFCIDRFPETRNTCTNVGPTGVVTTSIGGINCDDLYYDADDYARDWADFVAKIENPKLMIDQAQQRSWALIQRPTIYTIGFGLDFRVTNAGGLAWNPGCLADIDDCLGEELLRYIADVGDNNRIDSDWQQDSVDNGQTSSNQIDLSLASTVRDEFGDRGPCENPVAGGIDLNDSSIPVTTRAIAMLQPMDHGESCGNYYNAPDQRRLRAVFDDIAGKLFTRITR
jgi:hypothetical protein